MLGKANLDRTGLCGKAASHENKFKLGRSHYLALLLAKKHAHQEFTAVHMIGSNLSSNSNSFMKFSLSTLLCIIQYTAQINSSFLSHTMAAVAANLMASDLWPRSF